MVAIELFHTMKHRSTGNKGSVSIKLDMSKAYNCVEWHSIEGVLFRRGFQHRVVA